METLTEGFFRFGGVGHGVWLYFNGFFLLVIFLLYRLLRAKEVFLMGICAYFVLFFWTLMRFFMSSRRGGIKIPIDWALFCGLMELLCLALFICLPVLSKKEAGFISMSESQE